LRFDAQIIEANMADPDVDEDLFADLYVSQFVAHKHMIDDCREPVMTATMTMSRLQSRQRQKNP
jgi:hypothetical protein